MKLLLIKTTDEGNITPIPDKFSLDTDINQLINWLSGKPIDNPGFTKKFLYGDWGPHSKYKLNADLKIEAEEGNIVFFYTQHSSSGQKELEEYFIFIDLDTKWLINNNICGEDEADEIANIILDLIQFDNELGDKILLAYRSGIEKKNGIHILLKVDKNLDINQKKNIIFNLLRYIQENTSKDLKFSDSISTGKRDGWIDFTSLTNKIKTKWNILSSVSYHLNEEAIWKDFSFGGEPQKITIGDNYITGTHEAIWRYMMKSEKSLEDILLTYKDDLKKPASSNGSILLEDSIKRLWNYSQKSFWKTQKSEISKMTFFYIEGNKTKVDESKLWKAIEERYEISFLDDVAYLSKKHTSIIQEFYLDKNKKIWTLIPYILDDLGIKEQLLRNLIERPLTNIIRNRNFSTQIPYRDLDDGEHIRYLFKFSDGEVKILEISKNNFSIKSPQSYLAGTEVRLPFTLDKLNLNLDFRNWDLWKTGYFTNLIKDYRQLYQMIGFTQCMYKSHNNSGRLVILTDAINDEEDQSGTGKSVFLMLMRGLRKSAVYNTLDTRDKFALQNIDTKTQIVTIDELEKNADMFQFRKFYSPDGLSIEKKFRPLMTIQPIKMIMATNYMINSHKADEQRIIKVAVERYYERTKNPLNSHLGYKIFNDEIMKGEDFKTDLGTNLVVSDWWSHYIKFMIYCVQKYLNDKDTWIENHMPEDRESHTIAIMYSQGKDALLFEEVANNLTKIILEKDSLTTIGDEVHLFNRDLCNYLKYSNNNLGRIKHMIKNKLTGTSFKYKRYSTLNNRAVHIIQKIK